MKLLLKTSQFKQAPTNWFYTTHKDQATYSSWISDIPQIYSAQSSHPPPHELVSIRAKYSSGVNISIWTMWRARLFKDIYKAMKLHHSGPPSHFKPSPYLDSVCWNLEMKNVKTRYKQRISCATELCSIYHTSLLLGYRFLHPGRSICDKTLQNWINNFPVIA